MSIMRLILKEILHRKLNFVSALLAVVAAVSLFVAVLTTSRASQRETIRLMRDMGFNLLMVPKGTNMEDYWATDFAREEMPEEYVHRLAGTADISAEHYVAMLQKKVSWRGRRILLTGVLPELGAIGKRKKSPMGFKIGRGTCCVGYELAQSLALEKGDEIDVLGKPLTIARRLGESGSKDDIRIYAHLHDVQEILGKPGRINAIQALGCLCYGARLATIREQLAAALPETKVTEFHSIAVARAEMRQMVDRYAAFIMPAVLIVGAAWIGVLAFINVRERRQEIGILRALGFGSGRIASLFLGKAVLLGVVGAALGFAVGTWLALRFGPEIFKITFTKIEPIYGLLVWSLVVAPVIAALASLLPAMAAVTQDPAVTLTRE